MPKRSNARRKLLGLRRPANKTSTRNAGREDEPAMHGEQCSLNDEPPATDALVATAAEGSPPPAISTVGLPPTKQNFEDEVGFSASASNETAD
jgi:hypothetical protein